MKTDFVARSLRSVAPLWAAAALGVLAACTQQPSAQQTPSAEQKPSAEQTLATLAGTPIDGVAKDAKLQAAALEVGKKVYEANCAECHGVNLKGAQGGHASTIALADLADADPGHCQRLRAGPRRPGDQPEVRITAQVMAGV